MDIISSFNQLAVKTIVSLKEDLKSIRTGRASPSIVENLIVETYGGQSKLRLLELATITTDGPSSILIIPFDPSIIQDIEKSILKSPLGLTPAVQGSKILIKVEEKKVTIRNHRDDVRRIIKTAFEKKEMSEDEKYRLEKDIDSKSTKFMDEINTIKENKETEIREV